MHIRLCCVSETLADVQLRLIVLTSEGDTIDSEANYRCFRQHMPFVACLNHIDQIACRPEKFLGTFLPETIRGIGLGCGKKGWIERALRSRTA